MFAVSIIPWLYADGIIWPIQIHFWTYPCSRYVPDPKKEELFD